MRERYSRSGDNAKMKVLTFARNEDDLIDNSRTPTGTKSYFRSPSPSQNSLVLKFPIVWRGEGRVILGIHKLREVHIRLRLII